MRLFALHDEVVGRDRLAAAADPRFVVDEFEPAYRRLDPGTLAAKVGAAVGELRSCRACPRECGVDRIAGEQGTCNTSRNAVVASAFHHFGEEDCLRGWNGSGTIFFSLCNLRCVFCQNWDISQHHDGRERTADELAGLMLELQREGCHNINLVTPEHVVPQVVEAVAAAVHRGLRLPIVYNTSAYDSVGSLRLMEGLVDVYMPDFKFWEPATARRLARAADYPERAREAIREMHRQVGVLRVGRDGLARRGVLVRHLVMPGQREEATAIFAWLASELSTDTYVNVMGQYRPEHRVAGSARFADIDHRPLASERDDAVAEARQAGLWRFDERVLPW
ncbi:MAG TPA: radical SAM protein [Acidimicrobiales bacterium]